MEKKSVLLTIFVLFIVIIFSTGCATKFDITGTWTLIYDWNAVSGSVKTGEISAISGSASSGSDVIIFSGDKRRGTFSMPDWLYTGLYTVDGKDVKWEFDDSDSVYTGTAIDDNNMSGTMKSAYLNGTWSATR